MTSARGATATQNTSIMRRPRASILRASESAAVPPRLQPMLSCYLHGQGYTTATSKNLTGSELPSKECEIAHDGVSGAASVRIMSRRTWRSGGSPAYGSARSANRRSASRRGWSQASCAQATPEAFARSPRFRGEWSLTLSGTCAAPTCRRQGVPCTRAPFLLTHSPRFNPARFASFFRTLRKCPFGRPRAFGNK
jgi:hypothetical protein